MIAFCCHKSFAKLSLAPACPQTVLLQMQAERNLIGAALVDELNERFVLLSESCIPLYPAALVWAQLLSEPRSRIHACSNASDAKDENRRMTYRLVILALGTEYLAIARSPR